MLLKLLHQILFVKAMKKELKDIESMSEVMVRNDVVIFGNGADELVNGFARNIADGVDVIETQYFVRNLAKLFICVIEYWELVIRNKIDVLDL